MVDVSKPLISPLTDFTLLAVNGDDRHDFLHGQFINDLNLIKQPSAQLSAWCNPKGQVITNFLIINTGISYLLLFKKDLKEFVQKRLGMFILRSNVTIDDLTNASPIIGLANTQDLSSLGPNISSEPGTVQAHEGLITICLPDNSGRYLVIGNPDILDSKTKELSKSMEMTDSSIWQLLDILAGIPWITTKTQEQFLPQMLNLDALNGLSYQKGCYPGQEVIARLHYKGTVKKRITLFKLEQPCSIGEQICLAQTDNHVGIVINSAMHPDGNFYGLAIIESDKIHNKLIIAKNPDKAISLLDLPYHLPS